MKNVSSSLEKGDYVGAALEVGFETLGPAFDIGKAIFIGAKANKIEKVAINKAEDMFRAGTDPELIRQSTGWFQGPDKKWRFEIDDSVAQMKIGTRGGNWLTKEVALDLPVAKITGDMQGVGMKLDQVLDHPQLFEQYPFLRDYTVTGYKSTDPSYGRANGFARAQDKLVGLNVDTLTDPKKAKGILLHEVQHQIQAYEGFVRGNNISRFLSKEQVVEFTRANATAKKSILDNTSLSAEDLGGEGIVTAMSVYINQGADGLKALEKGMDEIGKVIPNKDMVYKRAETLVDYLKKNQPDIYAQLQSDTYDYAASYMQQYLPAFKNYHRTFGEVEARNVTERMGMSADERLLLDPASTQDVPMNKVQSTTGSRFLNEGDS